MRPRYWVQSVGAVLCLVVFDWFSPLVGFLLIVAAVALLFDVLTALWVQAGGTGGLYDHRQ